jgi:PAS domain S-box-containing protein
MTPEGRLHHILNQLADGVILLTPDDQILNLNRAAERIIGKAEAEVCGKTLDGIIDLQCPASPEPKFTSSPDSGPNSSFEIQLSLPYNETRHVRLSLAPMKSYRGRPAGKVVTLQDITQVKKLQEQAIRSGRLAAMGEMAVKIAHDIRNPLGSIELFASLLKKDVEGDEDKKMIVEHISSGVRSINHIISNLLLFIRPEQLPEMQVLDLHAPLKDSLFFAEHMISSESSVTLETEFAEEALNISGDSELLSQVILNLILNAIQAMPDGGKLTLSTTKAMDSHGRDMAEMRIADTGCGIPPQNMAQIFDPFFTTKKRGTGLGLSIVHNITQAHGGCIDIQSLSGKGTECIVSFPLCPVTEDQQCKSHTEIN